MTIIVKSDAPTLTLKAEPDRKIRVRGTQIDDVCVVRENEKLECFWHEGKVVAQIVPLKD